MKKLFIFGLFVLLSLFLAQSISAQDAPTISQILIDDMKLPSEGKLHGVPDNWDWNRGVVQPPSASWPTQYGAIQGWGHIYEDAQTSTATNTRVQIRNMQTWWLSKSTGIWSKVQDSPNNVEGRSFVEDYAGNASRDPSIQMMSGYQTVLPGDGYNFHFWHQGGGWDIPNKGDYAAIVTAYEARLVLVNPNGIDDRVSARFLAASAVDTYLSVANHGTPPIPNFGIGRAKRVTNDWRLFTHNTISVFSESTMRTNPPPIVWSGSNAGSVCTAKNRGDANCDNVIDVLDFALWRGEYMTGCGILGSSTPECQDDRDGDESVIDADFDTNAKVQLLDFQIWKASFGNGGGGNIGTITKPIKIVAIGDSITGLDYAWVYPLQDRMRTDSCEAGVDYDMIGYDQEFPNPDTAAYANRGPPGYDHQRISRGGFNARGMLNVVKERGFGGVPDVIVTYLSLNNNGVGYVDGVYNPPGDSNPATMKQDLKELIEFARTKNPKVQVILGLLQIGFGHEEITALAAEMTTQTSGVYVSRPPELGGNTTDGAHPNEQGSRILGGVLYEPLQPILAAHNICN